MNLSQLTYFQAVAELENYSRAAERLHVSQSSLSYCVATLEDELGVELFYKTGRNVRLTESGTLFLGHVRRSLQELEEGKRSMAARRDPLTGLVRLSFVNSMSTQFIPGLIQDFRADPQRRGVQFALRERNTTETLAAIRGRTADLGFGTDTGERDLEYHPVHTERLVVVAARDHPWSRRTRVPIELLEGEPYIAYAPCCGTRSFVDRMLHTAQVRPTTAFEVPTDLMVAGMAARGLGVGICPDLPELQRFDVVPLEIDGVDTSIRRVCLFWIKGDELLPAVRSVRDFIVAQHPLEQT